MGGLVASTYDSSNRQPPCASPSEQRSTSPSEAGWASCFAWQVACGLTSTARPAGSRTHHPLPHMVRWRHPWFQRQFWMDDRLPPGLYHRPTNIRIKARSSPSIFPEFTGGRTWGFRVADYEMVRTGVNVPLRVSHKSLLERAGPVNKTRTTYVPILNTKFKSDR